MQNIFKRYEIKYLINNEQYQKFLLLIKDKMSLDKFGKSLICNLYFDTDSYLLIRRSIEKPLYKEKMRLRNYNLSNACFLELKKKYKSVVYKRRECFSSLEMANDFIKNKDYHTQIEEEIVYFLNFYQNLQPRMFISYQREAYYGENDLRVTFDFDLLYRTNDLDLSKGAYGNKILDDQQILMEIKVSGAFPLWLSEFLTKEKIYSTSFSKYGRAYMLMKKGEIYV